MGIDPQWMAVFEAKGMVDVRGDRQCRPRKSREVAPLPDDTGDVGINDVFIVVPIRTVNGSNGSQGSWLRTSRRRNAEREAVTVCLLAHATKRDTLALGCVVTMTRLSAGSLDDDGIRTALKTVRDTVAQWLLGGRPGEMDSDSRIEWKYSQRKAARGVHGVTVSIVATLEGRQ